MTAFFLASQRMRPSAGEGRQTKIVATLRNTIRLALCDDGAQ